MNFESYIGRLDAAQTKELLRECLRQMDEDSMLEVLSEMLFMGQINAFVERLS